MNKPHIQSDVEKVARARIAELINQAQQPNYVGPWMLFLKELKRFWTVAGQTIFSPVVTTMLYFLVFGYSLGDRLQEIKGVPYVDFLVPGLVMLALISNAYINSAFSLFLSKIHGIIVDILITPLSYIQILASYTAASMVRAILIGCIIWAVAMIMGASAIYNIPIVLIFMVMTALAFALLGVIIAIIGRDFDHINLLPSFLITPLTFLGGVFYSIDMLPAPWGTVSLFNPILYMVNGLRYGMTGISDVPYWHGLLMLSAMIIVFGSAAYLLLKKGTNLRE